MKSDAIATVCLNWTALSRIWQDYTEPSRSVATQYFNNQVGRDGDVRNVCQWLSSFHVTNIIMY